jgi:hypothetical protein
MENQACAYKCDAHTRRAAKQREQDAFRQGLPHNSGSLGTQRHTQRYLSPSLHAADNQVVSETDACFNHPTVNERTCPKCYST